MDSKIKRIYVPMTETGFYILFCLQKPQHGYGIGQMVKEMTDALVNCLTPEELGVWMKSLDTLTEFFQSHREKTNENSVSAR